MLSVALIWIYMFPLCFIMGFSFIKLIGKAEKYVCRNFESYILAGLGIITVYSEIFSLFYKVGFWANVGLIILALSMFICMRKDILNYIKSFFKEIKYYHIAIGILLFLIFAYGASYGYIHYDTDLYHAQSIHWIEDYGVVKGLGNIHTRLAYNSAAFCLTALFSMSVLGLGSFHVCAGFLALNVAFLCTRLFSKKSGFKPCLSNAVRILAIYYILIIFDEMVSPESDYFMVLSVLALVILFLEELESDTSNQFALCLLSVFTMIIVSFKVSGSLIVLLTLYPLYFLIKDKDIRSIIKYVLCGFIFVAPFLIRSIVLSGYLVYPIASIDIFNFDFKIPHDIAVFDNAEIKVYGRGYLDISRANEPITAWIGDWFRSLGTVNKASFLMAIASFILLAVYLVIAFVKKDKENYKYLFVIVVSAVSFAGFILTSPNIRYGCIFLWLFPLLSLGYFYMNMIIKIDKGVIFKVCVSLFLVYKMVAFSYELASSFNTEHLIAQQEYGSYELSTFDMNGYTFYVPVEGDRTGYNSFPAVPYDKGAELITDDIKDGFRSRMSDGPLE